MSVQLIFEAGINNRTMSLLVKCLGVTYQFFLQRELLQYTRSLATLLSFRLCYFTQNGTVKCEEDTAWLRCNEYKHISIISAFWGRRNFGLCTEHTGNLKYNQYCPTTPMFLTKVKDACEGTTMCEIRCTKLFFNDQSCLEVYKYLEVYYKCVEVINGHEVVNEDNLLNANFLG